MLSVVLLLDPSSGSLKIDQFDFECSKHEEFIARQNVNVVATPSKKKTKKPPPSIMPDSPVGIWGIPERILQMMLVCLNFGKRPGSTEYVEQVADTASVFSDIAFSAMVCETPPNGTLPLPVKGTYVLKGRVLCSCFEDTRPPCAGATLACSAG